MAVVELVVGNTQVNNLYGLALSLAVSGVDILGIAGSYGLIACVGLRLPTWEACAKAFGTCSSHICVILALICALSLLLPHTPLWASHCPKACAHPSV